MPLPRPPGPPHELPDEFGHEAACRGDDQLDGELPVNPDGGLKSFGHPIGASGLRMLFECWLQLRGEAGKRQIENTGMF